jgi:hypothetical protein
MPRIGSSFRGNCGGRLGFLGGRNLACVAPLEESLRPFTIAQALAETFANLTGFYQVPTGAATELTLSLQDSMAVEPLSMADYDTAIPDTRYARRAAGGSWVGEFTIPFPPPLPGEKKPLRS